MPWLLNEDAALKFKLQGLQVIDANAPNGRKVPVRYRLPETEPANLTFPIIIISHQGWYPANEREHRGYTGLPYAPEGYAPWWYSTGDPAVDQFDPEDSPYKTFFPIPYNFDYQITVLCRFMHEHTIPLVSALSQYERLHPKFGFLDVPQDGTKRTLQLLGGPSLEEAYDDNGKRIFRINYLVRVFSELVPPLADSVINAVRASQVNLNLSVYSDTSDLTGSALAESKGLLSVGASSAWNVNQLTY